MSRVLIAALAAVSTLIPAPVTAQEGEVPAEGPVAAGPGDGSDPSEAEPVPDAGPLGEAAEPDDLGGGLEPPGAEGPLGPGPGAGTGSCIDTATGCVDPLVLADLLWHFEAAAEEEAAALGELSRGLDRLNDLEAQLKELNSRVAEVNRRLLAARSARRYADIRVEVARQNLDDVHRALAGEEDRLRQQAVAAFMGGADQRELDKLVAIMRSESLLEVESIRQYSEAVLDDQQRTIDRVVALRMAVEGMNAELDAAENEAARVQDEIGAIEADVEVLWRAHRDLVERTETEVEDLGRIVGEIRDRKDDYAAELFRSTAGAGGSIAALLRERQRGQQLPERTVGILTNPVPGAPIVSNFGPRMHPILGYVRIHAGVDISAPWGRPVRASADGTVVLAEDQGGFGLVTVIDHGNGIATLYAHLSAFAAAPGDVVRQGDLIGLVGSTGLSTGPHVHFEVRLFGQAVDPMVFLDLSAPGTTVVGGSLAGEVADHHTGPSPDD